MCNALVFVSVCETERDAEDDIITMTGRWLIEGLYGLLPSALCVCLLCSSLGQWEYL